VANMLMLNVLVTFASLYRIASLASAPLEWRASTEVFFQRSFPFPTPSTTIAKAACRPEPTKGATDGV